MWNKYGKMIQVLQGNLLILVQLHTQIIEGGCATYAGHWALGSKTRHIFKQLQSRNEIALRDALDRSLR